LGIDNLGITLLTGDYGTSVMEAGGLQGKASGAAGNTKDSLFQNLISMILDKRNLTSEAAVTDGIEGSENQSSGIGSMISELIAGASSKSQIQGADTAQNADEEEQLGALLDLDDSTDSEDQTLSEIQAAMLGLADISSYMKEDKMLAQAEKFGDEILSQLNAIRDAGGSMDALQNQRYFFNANRKFDVINDTAAIPETENPDLIPQETDNSTLASIADTTADTTIDEALEAIGNPEAKNTATGMGTMTEKDPFSLIQPTAKEAEEPAGGTGETKMEALTGAQKRQSSESELQNTGTVQNDQTKENPVGSEDDMKSDSKIETDTATGFHVLHNNGIIHKSAEISVPANGNVEAYKQIGTEILSKLEQKGPTEFKMQLQPENLGQIDISLKLSDGNLVINILAESAKTQALLTSQVDKLVSSMGLQNVQVESVQVNQQMDSGSQNSQNQNYQMNFGMDFSQRRQHSQDSGENIRQGDFRFYGIQPEAAVEDVSSIPRARGSMYKLDYVI